MPLTVFYQNAKAPLNIGTHVLAGVAGVLCLLIAFYLSYKNLPGKVAALITLFAGLYIEVACSIKLLETKKAAVKISGDVSDLIPPHFLNLILSYGIATLLFFAGLFLFIKYFKISAPEKI